MNARNLEAIIGILYSTTQVTQEEERRMQHRPLKIGGGGGGTVGTILSHIARYQRE